MIARIIYRNNVQEVLNYVLGKADNTILGFQNTYSDTNTDTKSFGWGLYYRGNRHDSGRRYVHATINLPCGEQLDDKNFFELSKAYMKHMGYEEKPYMGVRHHDTKPSPSPETRSTKELSVYEMDEFQKRDFSGVRFYIRDIVNIALQKYKVRSFKELE